MPRSGEAAGIEKLGQAFGRRPAALSRLTERRQRIDTMDVKIAAGETQHAMGYEGPGKPDRQRLQQHVTEQQRENRPRRDMRRQPQRAELRMASDIVEPARVKAREGDCEYRLEHEGEKEDEHEVAHDERDQEIRVFLKESFPIALADERQDLIEFLAEAGKQSLADALPQT